MRWPNCLRSRAYAVATSRAPCAIPTAWAAIPGRLRSSVRIAMSNPSPSAPRRFAAGTRTLSKASSAVGLPRRPILCSIRVTAKPVGRDLHDERGQAPMALGLRVRDREDHEEIRDRAVADEPLGPVDDVVLAVADGPGAGGRDIRARLGLGQGEGDELFAAGQLREPAGLLLVRAGDRDRERAELLDREDQSGRGAGPAELFDGETDAQELAAEAAVLLRERERQDVVVGEEAAAGPRGIRRSCRWRPRGEPRARPPARERRRGASRAPP